MEAKLKKAGQWWLIAKHTWKQQGLLLVGYVVAIVIVIVISHPFAQKANLDWYSALSSVLGAATLGVSLFVWFGARRQQWESSLQKRLTVIYFFAGRPVMACERATLMSESELRATSQQMGAQMVGGRLALGPVFHVTKPTVEPLKGGQDDEVVRHYQMWMTLTELPSVVADAQQESRGVGVLVRRVKGQQFEDVFEPNYEIVGAIAASADDSPFAASKEAS